MNSALGLSLVLQELVVAIASSNVQRQRVEPAGGHLQREHRPIR